MANEQNLKPCGHKFTREEQMKGCEKSAEVRSLRASVRKILEQKMPKGFDEIRESLESANIDTNNFNAISMAMIIGSLMGDKRCADWVRDTAGEKPKDEISVDLPPVIFEELKHGTKSKP